jgi:hypothetical protein
MSSEAAVSVNDAHARPPAGAACPPASLALAATRCRYIAESASSSASTPPSDTSVRARCVTSLGSPCCISAASSCAQPGRGGGGEDCSINMLSCVYRDQNSKQVYCGCTHMRLRHCCFGLRIAKGGRGGARACACACAVRVGLQCGRHGPKRNYVCQHARMLVVHRLVHASG